MALGYKRRLWRFRRASPATSAYFAIAIAAFVGRESVGGRLALAGGESRGGKRAAGRRPGARPRGAGVDRPAGDGDRRGRFAASVGRETRRPVALAVECRGSKAPHAAIASGLPGVIRACPIIMPAFPTGRDVPEFFIAEGDFVEDRFLSTGARARDLPSISQHSPDLGSRCSNRVPITEQKGAEWHEMKRNGGVGHYTHWGQPQSAGTSEKSNGFRREILIRANSD